MQLSNRLFFEQVEAMLAEGHEVQIRMKGHSMRPLLRSERDIAVLTPIARYTGNSETAAAARKQNRLARNETAPDTAANSHPDRLPSGSQALQPGDVVLFRCEGRHILHRILRIEPESGEMPPQSANTTVETITKTPEASAIPTAATREAATTAASATASNAGDTPAPLPALRETGKATPPLPARPENSENPQATSNPGQTPAETAPAPPRLRFTLAGDGNHRMTEHCAATDIAGRYDGGHPPFRPHRLHRFPPVATTVPLLADAARRRQTLHPAGALAAGDQIEPGFAASEKVLKTERE